MMQYLSDIKSKCDVIGVYSATLSAKDVILYTLNGLPSNYHAFQTTIKTNHQPINLNDFYSLLCSEELNIATRILKECSIQTTIEQQFT